MDLESVIEEVKSLGYSIDTRPFKLNVVGIRNPNITRPENYEDQLAYFYYDNNGRLVGKVAEGTTTPSVYWLNSPMNTLGTAILKQGQYVDTYGIDFHRGKYEALTQKKPVTVIRDNDRNSILNYFAKTTTGLYGINIHRSTAAWSDKDKIGQDSAGCQVFRFREDFDEMMRFARKSRDMYGNKFTYTLIDQREQLQNQRKKAINYGVIGLVLIGMTGYVYFLSKKLKK